MHADRLEGMGYQAGRWPLDENLPTLLFLHGAGGSSNHWKPQLGDLLDVANTLALDLPGHGASPPPGHDRVEEYTAAVRRFLDRLSAPGVVPVGFSMGGAIALRLLLDEPPRLRAAVLIATGAKLRVLPAIFDAIQNDFEGYIQMKGRLAASPKTDPARIRPVLEDTARCDPQVVLGDFRACDAFDVREELAAIDRPVLVISAEEDLLTPPKFGAYLEEHIRGARRVHLLDAGHLVSVEQAPGVNRVIREFVRGLQG